MVSLRSIPFHAPGRLLPAALYLAIAIVARFLPLTDELHYEFSALIALVVSIVAGLVVVAKRRAPAPDDVGAAVAHRPLDGLDLWRLMRANVTLAFVPLAVPLLMAVFTPSCGLSEGLAWYLLLVPPAAVMGTVVGACARMLARRRWLSVLLFLLLWSGSLVRGGYEALTGPHIFLYTWQIGFFPGGSWDAELPITATLVIYRAAHLLAACLLALVIVEIGRRRTSGAPPPNGMLAAVTGVAALAGLALITMRSDLGVTRTDAWLRGELGDSVRTRFSVIWYHRPSTDSLDLWRAANLTDFYIAEHAKTLGIPEDRIEPVTIYLYASPLEEKRLVGSGSAAFTKPWARKVNMPFSAVGSTLRHELAHVMLAPFGNPLGVSLSQGLLEGSAVALENNFGRRTLHEYARALYANRLAPPADEIMSIGGFSSHRTSVSYVLAGSFSKWLIDRFGIAPYLRAFAWGNFDDAYGQSLHQLATEYQRFIDSLPAPDARYTPTMRHLFAGGSFFAQKCLRRLGTLNARGYTALADGRPDSALLLFRAAMEDGINYGSRAGVIRSLAAMGRHRELLDSCRVYARDTASYPLLPFIIEQGDACWALGDTARARRLYDSAIVLDINDVINTRAASRLYFLHASDTLRAAMCGYFTRPMGLESRLLTLDGALAHTGDTMEQMVLTLMRAGLTVQRAPLASVASIAPWRWGLPFGSNDLSHPPYAGLDPHAERARQLALQLAARLTDAAVMANATALSRGTDADTGTWWILRVGAAQAFVPGSEAYLAERAAEASRFAEYLRRHRVLTLN